MGDPVRAAIRNCLVGKLALFSLLGRASENLLNVPNGGRVAFLLTMRTPLRKRR
jgi:hypothetical protein